MNLKKTSFLVFISFFPVFVFRSNLNLTEIILTISIFIFPTILINFYLISKKNINSKILKFYLSLIIVYGIDSNLGLWNGVIQPFKNHLFEFFTVIYYPGIFLLLILIFLIFALLVLTDKKFINVISIFLITIFVFNFFDQTKSFKKIKDYKKISNTKYDTTDVVIIFDEMSGLNSLSSETKEGIEFDEIAIELFKKYNFEYYSDIYSISDNSITSLSALLNLTNSIDTRIEVAKTSKNYFYEYSLEKSLLFEKFRSISIYQNIHFDYCNFANITKCKTYNPFNQKIYLKGYIDSHLTKIISLWKLNGSISSALIWRTLRELRIIDSNLEPEGHKTSFNDFFVNLEKDIYSNNFDFIFAHTLVPHRPYGFNKECNYDGSLSLRNTFYSVDEHIDQHNIERKCVVYFLDNFLNNLEKRKYLDKINLTILSDHGSRITKEDNSSFSVIYANREKQSKFKEIKKKKYSQEIFLNKYN